jgi:hypothetical protein
MVHLVIKPNTIRNKDVKNGKIGYNKSYQKRKKKVKLLFIETHSKLILNNVNLLFDSNQQRESRDKY